MLTTRWHLGLLHSRLIPIPSPTDSSAQYLRKQKAAYLRKSLGEYRWILDYVEKYPVTGMEEELRVVGDMYEVMKDGLKEMEAELG